MAVLAVEDDTDCEEPHPVLCGGSLAVLATAWRSSVVADGLLARSPCARALRRWLLCEGSHDRESAAYFFVF